MGSASSGLPLTADHVEFGKKSDRKLVAVKHFFLTLGLRGSTFLTGIQCTGAYQNRQEIVHMTW